MPNSIEQYQQEIDSLKREVQDLKRRQSGTRAISYVSMGPSSSINGQLSIAGLEEMFMVLDKNMVVKLVNTLMADWLGLSRTESARGRSLAQIDDSPLGPGVLMGLIESACNTGESILVERVIRTDEEIEETFRIAVQPKESSTQLVVQNVTRVRKLENTLIKYVSENVFQEMIARPEEDFLAVRKLDVTVLFADLRGFTTISESLPPDEVRLQINEYLTSMVGCVHRFDGTVIGFAGDEVFAVWGAPVVSEDHVVQALQCALQMQKEHESLLLSWKNAGRPTPGLGIGFNSGEAVCGNIGPPERLGYTALGYTTNIAARLCSGAKASEILITKGTYRRIAQRRADIAKRHINVYFSAKDPMTFKNVSQNVEVISVERGQD